MLKHEQRVFYHWLSNFVHEFLTMSRSLGLEFRNQGLAVYTTEI